MVTHHCFAADPWVLLYKMNSVEKQKLAKIDRKSLSVADIRIL